MKGWLAKRGIGVTTALVVLSLAVSALSVAANAALFAAYSSEGHDRDIAIRVGQIQNCHVLAEPLRRAVIQLLQDQIAQSNSADLKAFFPQIPPAKLKALIAESNARRQRVIDRLTHVPPCERRYTPSR